MRRILALVAAFVAALALTAVATGSASALGDEQLGCRLLPSSVGTYTNGTCRAQLKSAVYDIEYQVASTTGSGIGISWSVPAGYPILGGCTSSSLGCEISARSNTDQNITVSVVLTQGGASETLSATAIVIAVCGQTFC
ncbi:MAG TPA: hypothetical protein VF892_22630 [Pseudonocardiaceae bacterium]